MGAKKGRPFSGKEPLTHDLKIRVSEKTFDKLKEKSIEDNVTIAEIARKAIKRYVK